MYNTHSQLLLAIQQAIPRTNSGLRR